MWANWYHRGLSRFEPCVFWTWSIYPMSSICTRDLIQKQHEGRGVKPKDICLSLISNKIKMFSQAASNQLGAAKSSPQALEIENAIPPKLHNLIYEDTEVEPTFHSRTYLALASMFFLNLVQVAVSSYERDWNHKYDDRIEWMSIRLNTNCEPRIRLAIMLY